MIEAIVDHTREEVKEAAMSTADWLRRQGFEKGRKLGLEKGRKLGLEKGRKLGLEKGRKEGLDGTRTLLLRQLERRFGPLPARTRAKVKTATQQQLEGWALRVVTATSLAEALASEGRSGRGRRSGNDP